MWSDAVAGEDAAEVRRERLAQAALVLLLVSANHLASDRCHSDLEGAVARKGEAQVLLVLARPCDWESLRPYGLTLLPAGERAVTSHASHDEAWAQVAETVRAMVEGRALPAVRAPFHVPFLRNKGFVGREDDLARLHALLQKGAAVALRGWDREEEPGFLLQQLRNRCFEMGSRSCGRGPR
jgi:hypothetical protein